MQSLYIYIYMFACILTKNADKMTSCLSHPLNHDVKSNVFVSSRKEGHYVGMREIQDIHSVVGPLQPVDNIREHSTGSGLAGR